ncbi:MAG: glycosyltransferase family 39 protein [Nitrospinota bacterium]
MEQTRSPSFLFLVALFFVALSVRIFYLFELAQLPFFDNVLPVYDHYNFDLAAQSFAQGDWLAKSPNNSYSPLYKYFLGIIYWIFGRNFYAIYGMQFALGALGAVFIYLIGRYLFDKRVALIAFIGFAFYSNEIIYEGIILRASFITFLGILSFYLLLKLEQSPTPVKLVFSALVLSLFFQSRPNTFLCLPFVILFLHWNVFKGMTKERKLRSWLQFLVPLVLSLIPILVQCYLVHGRFVFFDSSGPTAFLAGNFFEYPGVGFDAALLAHFQEKYEMQNLSPVAFVFQQLLENPLGFIEMYFRKIYFFLNDLEAASNLSINLYLESSKLLPFLLSHFSIFSSLGLIGIVLAILNKEKLFLLYSFLGCLILSVVLFHVVSRFRVPAAPFFILFSAYAVGRALSWMAQKKFKPLVMASLVFVSFLYGFRVPENQVVIRYVDYCNWSMGYYGLGEKWFDLEKAEQYGIECWDAERRMFIDHQTKGKLDMIYKLYSYFLLKKNDEQAGEILKRAIFIKPLDSELFRMLAEVEGKSGKLDRAIRYLHISRLIDPLDPSPVRNLIKIYYRTKREPGKLLASLKAILPLEKDPGKLKKVQQQISTLESLIQEKSGEINQLKLNASKFFAEKNWLLAIDEFNKLNAYNSTDEKFFIEQGISYESIGKKEEALVVFYDGLLINPDSPELNRNLGDYYFKIHDFPLAIVHWTRYINKLDTLSNDYEKYRLKIKGVNKQLESRKLIPLIGNLTPSQNRELYKIFNKLKT